jgi:hypothetical protein
MRRALLLFAVLACARSRQLAAQQALAQTVTLPSGVKVARACDRLESEGVLVAPIDTHPLIAMDSVYFKALAQTIARRVGMRAGDPPREATYGVLLLRDGTFAQRFPVVRSGQRDLDTSIDGALAISGADVDRAPMPGGMPDSQRVLVTFGQHEDGSPFVATHTRCPAVLYPDTPPREMPIWARAQPRSLTIRGIVSAAGRVDTATALVDDPGDERYVEAAMRVVAQLRYVPAEFDGVKVPTPIAIVVPFGVRESEDQPAP